jgi:alpha-beta hydrolase superfamily lysophospholipase
MRKRILVITLAVGIPAFLLTRVVFPLPEFGPQASGVQVPLFVVAVLLTAPRVIRELPAAQRGLAWAVALGLVWFLGNWWIHDGLHVVVGQDMGGLLAIEYGFHLTLIIAGAAMASALVRLARMRRDVTAV